MKQAVGLFLNLLTWPFRKLWEGAVAWYYVYRTSDACDSCYVNSGGLTIEKAFFYCGSCTWMVCVEHSIKMLHGEDPPCCKHRMFGRMKPAPR